MGNYSPVQGKGNGCWPAYSSVGFGWCSSFCASKRALQKLQWGKDAKIRRKWGVSAHPTFTQASPNANGFLDVTVRLVQDESGGAHA